MLSTVALRVPKRRVLKAPRACPLPFCNSKELFFDEKAFAFTLGNLLGDGHIHRSKNQLHVDQANLEYTVWKKRQAEQLRLATLEAKVSEVHRTRVDKVTGKETKTTSFRFYCRSLFKEWRPYFYTEKKPTDPTFGSGNSLYRKCIPQQLPEWFTSPYALAIFYLDDGGVLGGSAYFATGELPSNEVLLFKQAMEQNFGLEFLPPTQRTNPSGSYRAGLLLRRRSLPRFVELVEPVVEQVPSLRYKLQFSS